MLSARVLRSWWDQADGSFLNIITELIAGYAWPGNAIANMCVKMYGYNSVKHGMDFAQDLKLGQYMVRAAQYYKPYG